MANFKALGLKEKWK